MCLSGAAAASEPAQATPSPTTKLGDLPDEILVRCLALLSPADRFKNAAPVSRHFCMLCWHPQLLRHVNCHLQPDDSGQQQSIALFGLLEGHGEHVQHLSIAGAYMEVADQLACCLSRAPPALQTLGVVGAMPSAGMLWLPRLTALRTLRLDERRNQPLRLPAGFSCLTQLAEADLAGRGVEFEGSRLPSGLTQLSLKRHTLGAVHPPEPMPQQLSTLTNLAQLHLPGITYTPDSMAPLTACTALRDLRFHANRSLPACLPQLTQLERLVAHVPVSPAAAATMRAALPALTRLSFLSLNGRVEGLLPDIGGAQHIQTLALLISYMPRGAPPLAASPWLACLRWLGLPWSHLAVGFEALRAAPQLEHLRSIGTPHVGADEARWQAFWELVATHPPLRCLELQAGHSEAPSPALQAALAELAAHRPGLCAVLRTALPITDSWDEMVSGAGNT